MKNCILCNNKAELLESHIIPKFVFKWMKETGTGRFRQSRIINKPLQDGIKKNLLCKTCENEFGKRENWFKKNVFDKYLLNQNTIFKTNEELIYFSVSILWRVLIYFKDDGNNYRFKNKLNLAASEWKDFLINNKSLNSFRGIHLVFIPEDIDGGGDNFYSYFHRVVDIEICESDAKAFVYAKFSRFIIIGFIDGICEKDFVGTNIINCDELNLFNQYMNDLDVSNFIMNRFKFVKSYSDLSEIQQLQNDKYFSSKIDKIQGNDYWRALIKDLNRTKFQ